MNQKKFINSDFSYEEMSPGYRLAHAYVPFQVLKEIYGPREALCKGTLFPELHMPNHRRG